MRNTDRDTLARRDFLRRGAGALVGASAFGLGGVGDLLARAARGSLPASAGAGSAGGFNMAVIGDSVMWGQGLHDLQKFSTRVSQFIGTSLNGRAVSLQQAAHSGAVIGYSDPASVDADWDARDVNGEFPSDFPTIAHQATRQIYNPENIDLLLLDGGINDAKVGQIMDLSTSTDWLRNLIGRTMRDRLPGLLDVVVPRYPKATIVMTNYFPVISDETSTEAVLGLVNFFLGPLAQAYRTPLAERWRIFHADSTAAIRQAVNDANARFGTQRVRFVDAGFGPSNAVGASTPWLYAPGEADPVDYWRKAVCESLQPDLFQREACYRANTGHPNRFGAEAYAAAIIREITPLVPGWLAQGTPNTLALRVVSVSTTTTMKTIVVYATDATTGEAKSGTVTINGATGAIGARISFGRCRMTEDLYAGKFLYGPCEGSVSVPGYPSAGFTA